MTDHDRDQPVSDHTDITWRQLEELVNTMKADGRIPRWDGYPSVTDGR